ncbi:ABC transporter permease [Nonomuraea sp. NPDC050540]|uniref:ABC transporter permease n=1 Tax=Nonomuraea sp. NPDC050540 TaxID=3364367 RepID=UPI00379DFE39
MMRPLLTVSALELRTRLRDGTALIIAVIVPVALATLFGLALGGDDPPLRATVGVVDLDRGRLPADVRREIAAAEQFKGVLTLRDLPSEQAARRAVDDGGVGAAIVFGRDFSRTVGAGGAGQVSVLTTPESPLAGVVARSLVERIAVMVESRALTERFAAGPAQPLSVVSDPLAGGKVDLSVYYGSGMAALFAFFVVGASFRSLLTERKLGTLNRMRAGPLAPWVPVAGKAIVGFALALFGVCVTWASSTLIFGTTWGDPVAVFAVLCAHVLAAAAITMLVASRVKTDAQADGVIMAVSFVAAFFGGSLVPIPNLPDALQVVALFTPNGWTSQALVGLAGSGDGLASVALPIGVLCAIALTAGGLAAVGLKKGLLG